MLIVITLEMAPRVIRINKEVIKVLAQDGNLSLTNLIRSSKPLSSLTMNHSKTAKTNGTMRSCPKVSTTTMEMDTIKK